MWRSSYFHTWLYPPGSVLEHFRKGKIRQYDDDVLPAAIDTEEIHPANFPSNLVFIVGIPSFQSRGIHKTAAK